MKGQIDEPVYAEANNNFLKEVSSFGTTLVSRLGTTLNTLLNVKSAILQVLTYTSPSLAITFACPQVRHCRKTDINAF